VSSGTGQTGTFSIIPMWTFTDRAGRVKRIPGAAVSTGVIANKQIDIYVSKCPMRALDGATAYDIAEMEPELYITDGTNSVYTSRTMAAGIKTRTTARHEWPLV